MAGSQPVVELLSGGVPRTDVVLAGSGADYRVYRYEAGHGSLVVAETMRQFASSVAFAREILR